MLTRLLKPDEAGALIGVSPKTTGQDSCQGIFRGFLRPAIARYCPIDPATSRRIKVCKKYPLQKGMQNSYRIIGNSVAIEIRRRSKPPLEALIDILDLPIVAGYPGRFYAMWNKQSNTFYCVGHKRGMRSVLLHRLIMQPSRNKEVDHIFHDGLDNRRQSLRVVTRSQNALNRRGARKGSKSGVRGIYWSARLNMWRAQSRLSDGRRVDVPGSYSTVAEAVSAKASWESA